MVDITDPTHPVDVGTIEEVGSSPGSLAVFYPYVYWGTYFQHLIGSRSELHVINVADPVYPILIKSIPTFRISHIAFQDNFAYITFAYDDCPTTLYGLAVFDVSSPENPTVISYGSLNRATDLVLGDNYAVLIGSSCADGIYNALFIEDITDPWHLSRLNVLPEYDGVIAGWDDTIYLGMDSRIHALNMSDPGHLLKLVILIYQAISLISM